MASNRCLVYLQPTVLQKGRLLFKFFVWHKENSQLMLNMCNIKNIRRMMTNAMLIAEQTASVLCQKEQSWPQGSAVVYLILRISLWVINLPAVHNSWQLLFSANTLYVFWSLSILFFLIERLKVCQRVKSWSKGRVAAGGWGMMTYFSLSCCRGQHGVHTCDKILREHIE